MRYLSQDWIEAANAAVGAAASTAPEAGVVIDQYVHGTINYQIVIKRDQCSIVELDGQHDTTVVDATFRQDLATARAVAQGTTDSHQAFLLGQITFEGNIDVLIDRRDALIWLESALAPVMADTTFD